MYIYTNGAFGTDVLEDLLYDENPYLIISDEGKQIWVLDAYTISNAYPCSQKTIIEMENHSKQINYIRNSVKVLVDAYTGETKFYIIDRSDPIIMTYNNMYSNLFEIEEIDSSIKEHFIYPEFLYKVQAEMINLYHDISEDVLYRADDIWQITTKPSSKNSNVSGIEMEPYYTILKTKDNEDVYLYKNGANKSFNYLYADMLKKEKAFKGEKEFRDIDELKVPNIKFFVEKSFAL